MSTNFPSSIDSFVNPTASPPGTDKLSTSTVKHSTMHTNENDAIVAIETYLGQVGDVSSGTITGRLSTLTSGAPTSGTYLTLSALSGAAARTFTPGAALSGTDAGSGSTYTLRVYPTGVTSGTYYKPTITVNASGQLTFASDYGDSLGLVQGAPLVARVVSGISFAGYIPEKDVLLYTTKIVTGTLWQMDRTMDYPVAINTFSGRTPGNWIYSTIITGMLVSNGATTAFTCTVTGGILVTGVTLGMDGGAAIRTTVSGMTIYANSISNSRIEMYDPASNVNLGTISLTGSSGAGGVEARSMAYVSGTDCVYLHVRNSDIYRIACTTNTVAAIISGVGLNLSATASLTYNLTANKVFCCGTNVSANKTWYITPGVDSITSLAFPSGYHGTNGAAACISFGKYVYFCTDAASPSVVLVLNAVTLTWERPLGIIDSTTTTTNKGEFMAGVLAEGVLYIGTSLSGFYTYGRV